MLDSLEVVGPEDSSVRPMNRLPCVSSQLSIGICSMAMLVFLEAVGPEDSLMRAEAEQSPSVSVASSSIFRIARAEALSQLPAHSLVRCVALACQTGAESIQSNLVIACSNLSACSGL